MLQGGCCNITKAKVSMKRAKIVICLGNLCLCCVVFWNRTAQLRKVPPNRRSVAADDADGRKTHRQQSRWKVFSKLNTGRRRLWKPQIWVKTEWKVEGSSSASSAIELVCDFSKTSQFRRSKIAVGGNHSGCVTRGEATLECSHVQAD